MKMNSPRKIRNNRAKWLLGFFLTVMVILIGRLAYVQIFDHARYVALAKNEVEKNEELYSPRGTIYDRNGNQLAISVMVKSLYCDPATLNKQKNINKIEMAEILSPILNISEEELLKKFSQEGRFVWIKRLMEPEEALKVEELLKSKDWERFLGFREESKRYYPNGRLLANVIGFVGVDDKALDGLELYLGDILKRSKEANSVRMRIDAKGNPIMESALTPYKSQGENSVYLTIDQTIQFYAERALDRAMTKTKAQGGIIIVMDPKTGEILALGNRPTYDPNHFEKAVEKDFKNKAVTDIYEPGSTFKPIIAAAALDAGTYSTETVWHDPGKIWASGHAIRNWDDGSYGDVKLVDIIKYSINTGFAHIGLLTGGKTLTEYALKFGFGKPTGIELPGEGAGILFNPDDMRDIDVATMSIGQSIAVTPLQMLQAYSALANGGQMVKPHILRIVNNPDGSVNKVYETEYVGNPVSKKVADEVKDMMEKEVSEGGGINARVPGYHMGGKTGTAQKIDPVKGGYLENEYIASFCGFGPTEDPRAICLVVLDNPRGVYYGGQVAAPVFKETMGQIMRYMGIPAMEEKRISSAGAGGYNNDNLPALPGKDQKAFLLPNFYGWSIREVGEWLYKAGLGFQPDGNGSADSQSPGAGETVQRGDNIRVHFSDS